MARKESTRKCKMCGKTLIKGDITGLCSRCKGNAEKGVAGAAFAGGLLIKYRKNIASGIKAGVKILSRLARK